VSSKILISGELFQFQKISPLVQSTDLWKYPRCNHNHCKMCGRNISCPSSVIIDNHFFPVTVNKTGWCLQRTTIWPFRCTLLSTDSLVCKSKGSC